MHGWSYFLCVDTSRVVKTTIMLQSILTASEVSIHKKDDHPCSLYDHSLVFVAMIDQKRIVVHGAMLLCCYAVECSSWKRAVFAVQMRARRRENRGAKSKSANKPWRCVRFPCIRATLPSSEPEGSATSNGLRIDGSAGVQVECRCRRYGRFGNGLGDGL